MTRNTFILAWLTALPFVGKYFKRKVFHYGKSPIACLYEGGYALPHEYVKHLSSLHRSTCISKSLVIIPPEWENMTFEEQLNDCEERRGVVI